MDNSNVALITKMVLEAIEKQKASAENGYLVPVGVSARHIHLTQEHVEALFGEGYQLTKKKELMGGLSQGFQPGSRRVLIGLDGLLFHVQAGDIAGLSPDGQAHITGQIAGEKPAAVDI